MPDQNDEFILGVDVDGVIANYEAALRTYGCTVLPGRTPESFPAQTQWSLVGSGWFDTEEQFLQIHADSVAAGMFATMDPIDGASKALHTLSDEGIRIRIITHRLLLRGSHKRVVSDTVSFLDQRDMPYRDICFVADKTTVGCDLLIDDAPHNIQAARAAGTEAIAFDQPYNRHLPGPRAINWDEAVHKVLKARRSKRAARAEAAIPITEEAARESLRQRQSPAADPARYSATRIVNGWVFGFRRDSGPVLMGTRLWIVADNGRARMVDLDDRPNDAIAHEMAQVPR